VIGAKVTLIFNRKDDSVLLRKNIGNRSWKMQ